jgi:hypothetical protein
MSDNAPKTSSGFAAWIPLATLALTAAAFGLNAPAKIARGLHRSSMLASLQEENVMRDEPLMFPMPAAARLPRLNAAVYLRR